jgi:signal transduction histidine kinase/ABC-type amino acid transport substrate-binding protein
VVVCDWDKPPYEFLDDKGMPAGSNIDVLNAVMEKLNLPVKYVMKEWSIALKNFERGDADIILANARRYRKGHYAISENIVNYNRIRVAMHSDSIGMVTLKQLEREGAVFKPGDYSAYYFQDGDTINTSFMEFQSPKTALTGLINGDYKYYVWGEAPLKWKIKELQLEGIILNDVSIPISEIHIIGHDKDLIERMDDQYSRLKQSGVIAQLQDKWLHPERVKDESAPVLLYIGIGTLILIALIYLFIRLAKAHVKSATRRSTELNDMMYKALHMGNFNVMEYDIKNDRMTNHYGHILPKEGISLAEYTRRIHPDQQAEFTQKMKRLIEGRERHFELNKRWNKGTDDAPDWLNFQGHAISELAADGHPEYIVNAIHDVTQDMEEDKAGRELVRKYERLSNIPFIAMSFYSKEGWLMDLNDSMKELCGMDDPETKRFWESVCMFDVPLFRNVYSPDDRNDLLVCQHMDYPEMGIDRYIEFNILPLFNADGEIANYFITTLDVTADRTRDHLKHLQDKDIQLMQAEIENRKQRLNYLLKNSQRFLWHSDIENRMLYYYRQLGEPEISMDFDTYLSYLAEEDRHRTLEILNSQEMLNNDFHGDIYHFNHTTTGPEEGWFEISGQPIRNKDGKVTGHFGVSIDITNFMKARKELEVVTKQASESVRMKSGFMASMTHELRTPLNAIVGFTSVLSAFADSPERPEYVRIIRNSSDMLQRLINDIIDASSLTDGVISIKPEQVDFARMFDDICFTLQQRIEKPEVQFWKDNPYKSFVTTIDPGRIQQVLTNFLTNAVKFTKEGHIRLGYRYQNDGLYLFCEDTGAGIPKDKQQIVFNRFVKLDEFVQGTGMGLAICKSIAESCGGKIGVDSEGAGKGSTFWLWIPCKQAV